MTPPPDRAEIRRRAALALLVSAIYLALCWRPEWMALFGVSHLDIWFMDTRAVLAASDAAAAGINPYGRNPLQLFNQPHWYSDWWFVTSKLGLTRFDHVWVGALLGFSFLGVALLQMRVRSMGELLWSAAFLVSPPFILAFNRGNADLVVVIVLCATVPCLLARHRWVRWLAVASILIATGLKYYPVAAALVLIGARNRPRETGAMLVAVVVLTMALALDQWISLRSYMTDNPERPSGFFTFGFKIAPQQLHLSARMTTALMVALVVAAVAGWWRVAPRWTPPPSADGDHLRFVLGSTLLAACYFLTINYSYRTVVAIWMMPFLWQAWSSADWPAFYRRLGRVVSVLVLGLLWIDGFSCLLINVSGHHSAEQIYRWTDQIVLAEQPLVAALMIGLLGFLVPFLRESFRSLVSLKIPSFHSPLSS